MNRIPSLSPYPRFRAPVPTRPTVALAFVLLCAQFRAQTPAEGSELEMRRTPVVRVFEQAAGAVVNIACVQLVESRQNAPDLFEYFFDYRSPLAPRQRQVQVTSVGSGFVIHPDGYVVTNAHVVMKAVDQRVIFVDGSEYKAQPVAIDSESDLAVLKIQADRPLAALSLGRSDDLMIGETVIAIGNPLGYHHTLTTGVISALHRTVEFSDQVKYEDLIQTDASINPGNSGGPLLNVLGELVGVNTAIRGDAQNIGFSIPVDKLRATLPRMLSLERLKRVKVGLQVSGGQEVLVVGIDPGSPADGSGILPGDRIVRLDGRPIQQDVELFFALLSKEAGSRVSLDLQRQGRSFTVSLTLKAIPIPDGAMLARRKFGLRVLPLKAELSQTLGLEGGIFVAGVDPDGSASRAGVRAGMILVTVAGAFPKGLDQIGLLLETVNAGQGVDFQFWDVERYGGRLLIRPYRVSLTAR